VRSSGRSEVVAPTIIIGDVHGCLDELKRLLAACGFRRGDPLVLVGDLVAKGPDSQGVVQLAREEGARAVLGNHDDHLLRTRAVTRGEATPPPKGIRPERQRVADTMGAADWAYLESLPVLLRLGPERAGGADTVVLHGGAAPGVPLEEQSRQQITNMRSIDDQGQPSKRIEGRPWASVWRGPESIVFGHDAVRGLQEYPFAVGLDTGCVYGKRLTALIVPERRMISVPARRPYAAIKGA
jgi:hypothetical protein